MYYYNLTKPVRGLPGAPTQQWTLKETSQIKLSLQLQRLVGQDSVFTEEFRLSISNFINMTLTHQDI